MEAATSAYTDQVRASIRQHGWAALDIPAPDGDTTWVYTAGLTEIGLPELVMVDVPSADMFITGAAACLDYLAGLSLDEELRAGGVYDIPTTNRVRVTDAPPDHGVPWMIRELYADQAPRLLLVSPIYED